MTQTNWINHLQMHIQLARANGFESFAQALERMLKQAMEEL